MTHLCTIRFGVQILKTKILCEISHKDKRIQCIYTIQITFSICIFIKLHQYNKSLSNEIFSLFIKIISLTKSDINAFHTIFFSSSNSYKRFEIIQIQSF